MKSHRCLATAVERLWGLIVCLCAGTITYGASELPMEWPRVVFRDGVTNTIFQPQLQSWDYATLKAVSTVAVQPKGAGQPTFGAIKLTAKTRVDRAARTVFLEQPEITQANFPSAGTQAEAYLKTLRSLLPREMKDISLDRLEAGLAILEARQRGAAQPLKNDPPTIVFSTRPAMLVPVDGRKPRRGGLQCLDGERMGHVLWPRLQLHHRYARGRPAWRRGKCLYRQLRLWRPGRLLQRNHRRGGCRSQGDLGQ